MINILTKIIRNNLGLISYPSYITYLVTWKCNCRCIMCDIWKKENQEELNLEDIKIIFKQLKKIDAVRISGGEPFLRNDLAEIINAIDEKTKPSIIHITSNGLLTDRIVSTIKKINNPKKIHIKISIDSIGKDHDEIRGVPNAYQTASKTLNELNKIRGEYGFYLGVDQTIVNKNGIESYKILKKELEKMNVSIHPVIAYKSTTALYSDAGKIIPPENSFETYGEFSKEELSSFLKELIRDAKKIPDFKERMIKKYYLKGLFNRLILDKKKPNPKCVALNNHLRILPNGDIPVCMYNSTIVGNLKKEDFKDIWFGKNIKKQRLWVRECSGCWVGCESNVNAIYSGNIIYNLF